MNDENLVTLMLTTLESIVEILRPYSDIIRDVADKCNTFTEPKMTEFLARMLVACDDIDEAVPYLETAISDIVYASCVINQDS